MWTNPITSSAESRMTGYRLCGCSETTLAALNTGIDASRKSTSVRGSMTSRSSRSPAANTSSMSSRSSIVRSSWAATRSRSSSPLICSLAPCGSMPNSRTIASVATDSATMNGLKTFAMTSMGRATKRATFSTRCRAMRFGTSSPRTSET